MKITHGKNRKNHVEFLKSTKQYFMNKSDIFKLQEICFSFLCLQKQQNIDDLSVS
jgi:hypothetical protein